MAKLNIAFTHGEMVNICGEYYDLTLYNTEQKKVYKATLPRPEAAQVMNDYNNIKMIKPETKIPGLPAIETAESLKPYGLIWDAGSGFISTMCNTLSTANKVVKAIKEMGLNPHQMNTNKRIIVLYN